MDEVATERRASLRRETRETTIEVELCVDGRGRSEVDTGLGFLDHMLQLFAAHGLFDLKLRARGDLHVDAHHTVEDVGLALGQCFARAMGNCAGIQRMASVYVPLDETLARVVVDVCGRPFALVRANLSGAMAGQVPTALIPHLLEAFAREARITLHAEVLYGEHDHHRAECLFKGLGRALDQATRLDPRLGATIPSTKGTLTG